jgi:hypothetical protein
MKALQLFETSGTTYPATQRQMPENLNPARVISISDFYKAALREITQPLT